MRSSGAAGAGPGAAPARRAPHFRQNFAASSLAVPQLEQNITAASRDTGVVSRAHGATTRVRSEKTYFISPGHGLIEDVYSLSRKPDIATKARKHEKRTVRTGLFRVFVADHLVSRL